MNRKYVPNSVMYSKKDTKHVTFSFSAYGKVFLVRKVRGPDRGNLYAMKVKKYINH